MAETVHAAGAVTWRRVGGHTELLMIHRPKYDDWTFPKGKLDRGERHVQASVREVEEETGVRVRLGVPLLAHEYPMRGNAATKRVQYWSARPVGGDDVASYAPNHEVDGVRWVRLRDVAALLTYDRDRDVLARFRALKRRKHHKTRTLVVVRHAAARARSRWKGPDTERTLTRNGERQAVRMAPILTAYGVRDVVSSDAQRCVATVTPYADSVGTDIVLEPRLAEDGARRKRVRKATYDLLDDRAPVVAATHRPVLPYVTDALGLDITEPLMPGELLVVHHRDGDVVATERHST
ncbi:NUDIX hydrolase [Solicola gregarius]|uniref:NUDIX domain-containing protein n=1 Tax=Solicola gregarius TaxID=2908642 RepID=A0AA46TE17_9ACTN|nr:NUDIX hydrolase [Solicola gregarius]UYM03624.1 NUDIX domain-containing protein [Solicola gregarius]